MPTRFFLFVCLLFAASSASAETLPRIGLFSPNLLQPPKGEQDKSKKKITLDNMPGGGKGGKGASAQTWLDEDHFLQWDGGQARKVDALTGKSQPLFDTAKLVQGLADIAGMNKNSASKVAAQQPKLLNPQRTGGLYQSGGTYYYCNFDGTGGVKLPKLAGAEMMTFSPDNKRIAFVRGSNLYVMDLETQTERQLTKDGNGILSNGKADWVYFEEIFNRAYKAFWWSPDSASIAFLHFDDTKVAKYTLIDPTATVQTPEVATYPKAGATNPTVKVGLAAASGDSLQWVDLGDYPDKSLLVPRAGWMPDGKKAYLYVQDRAQTWLDVCTVPPEGGKPVKLFRETTKAWVEDLGPLTFLKDGSFLFVSERTGYKHLYHYTADGQLKGAVTSGDWEMRKLERIDEAGGWVYFSGTRDGWLGSQLYRVQLDGKNLEKLTEKSGTHRVNVSPGGKYFVDTWSNFDTPPQVCLCQGDGKLARIMDAGKPNNLKVTYDLGKHEFVQIKMPDGMVLDGSVLLPPDYDAKKKYPVWFMTYAGPQMPTLHDTWNGGGTRDQALATAGYIIFRFDPRSASGKGAISAWSAYRQLGVQELKDIEAAILWLIETYPGVDAKRIGMSGHSYGGYITAYALTHSKLFAAGIAGSPVTDWHNYDSIYTERYMNTPQDNPKGYKASSVVEAAKNLHGKLLLIHGMMDDNVHVQNTMQLVDALEKANRDFELMIYPHARHGIGGAHYQRLQLDFMKRVLQPGT